MIVTILEIESGFRSLESRYCHASMHKWNSNSSTAHLLCIYIEMPSYCVLCFKAFKTIPKLFDDMTS